MAPELIEDAGGDPRNVAFLALASDLSYLPEVAGAEAFRTELGLEARLISADNTQAYVAHNANHIVVAFRGTEAPTSLEGLKDWLLTDAMNLLILPEGRLGTDLAAAGVGARFHKGFVIAIGQIWDPVYAAVDALMKVEERPLWLTGHSLGGALALLAGWLFQRKMVPVHQLYTFGAPMIGNDEAARAFDRELEGKIFRYVSGLDPVPNLPTMSLIANQYLHCQKEVILGTVGSAAELFQQAATRTVDGLLTATLCDQLWQAVQERVAAHSMESYRQLINELTGRR
jgi:triacylglycerol lipase